MKLADDIVPKLKRLVLAMMIGGAVVNTLGILDDRERISELDERVAVVEDRLSPPERKAKDSAEPVDR